MEVAIECLTSLVGASWSLETRLLRSTLPFYLSTRRHLVLLTVEEQETFIQYGGVKTKKASDPGL